jgi:hypothetical protein
MNKNVYHLSEYQKTEISHKAPAPNYEIEILMTLFLFRS